MNSLAFVSRPGAGEGGKYHLEFGKQLQADHRGGGGGGGGGASERAGKSDWDFSCGGAASERSFH